MRQSPSDSAEIVHRLVRETAVFVIDDSHDNWTYVQAVSDGTEGWVRQAVWAVVIRHPANLFVTKRPGRAVVKLRKRASLASGATPLQPGAFFTRRSSNRYGWWHVTTLSGRRGWIFYPGLQPHVSPVAVPFRREADTGALFSSPPWLIAFLTAMFSGVVATLIRVVAREREIRLNDRARLQFAREVFAELRMLSEVTFDRVREVSQGRARNVIDVSARRIDS
jgi:SH3-like domain-containing protein